MQIIPDAAKVIALNQANRLTGMEKIIGGHKVDVTDYPYQLSLRSYDHHICGASVISMHWALSAAHCVYPQREPRTVSFHHVWAIQCDNRSCFSLDFIARWNSRSTVWWKNFQRVANCDPPSIRSFYVWQRCGSSAHVHSTRWSECETYPIGTARLWTIPRSSQFGHRMG